MVRFWKTITGPVHCFRLLNGCPATLCFWLEFIKYLEERESDEQEPEAFLKFLDKYILNISNKEEKLILIDFYKHFEFCIGIKTEFPKYVRNKVEKEINLFKIQHQKIIPQKFLSINDHNTFYNFIKEKELKYFSKLIPRPVSLIKL